MNGEELMSALGGVGLKYIDEAATYRTRAKKRRLAPKLIAAAACLAVIAYAGVRLLGSNSPAASDLPTIQLTDSFDGAGSFIMYAPDFSDYLTGSPWSEDMRLAALPVYENALEHAPHEQNRVPLNADRAAMRALLDEAIAALGYKTGDFEFSETYASTYPGSDGEAYLSSLTAESGDVYLAVSAALTLRVDFAEPVALDAEFDPGSSASCAAAGEAAAEKFAALLGFETPRVAVSGGDVNYAGERRYSVCIYDAGASDAEAVANYSLRRAELIPGEDGRLAGLRIDRRDLTDVAGDYPLISVDAARELLLGGGALPTTLEELRAEDILGVELIYEASEYDEYFVPYYRFYLADTSQPRDGLEAFTWYCVPAISPQYIEGSIDFTIN